MTADFHYQTFELRTPVAQKNHLCDYCYGPILPGTKYVRAVGIMEYSGFFSHAFHVECTHSDVEGTEDG